SSRASDRHSDSIMLVRTDPSHHRIVYLSIPRDLRVPIPGHGDSKINAAFQIGGPALAIRTVRHFTGLPINHVVTVDFGSFKQLIDDVGGIDINVPENILSNRFDCPYASQARCQRWPGWVYKRAGAGRAYHCRLGGSASSIGGESVIVPTQENFAVVHMVKGDSAPQPPPPGSGPYGPGCVIGDRGLSSGG